MNYKSHSRGFTLVEVMIVVAIIALLASLAVPNFMRARKRAQATSVLQELRVLDAAIDQYAIENNKITGMHPKLKDLKTYLKPGTSLYASGRDIFGNNFGTFTVDTPPKVPKKTYKVLSDVADASFWSPYN